MCGFNIVEFSLREQCAEMTFGVIDIVMLTPLHAYAVEPEIGDLLFELFGGEVEPHAHRFVPCGVDKHYRHRFLKGNRSAFGVEYRHRLGCLGRGL